MTILKQFAQKITKFDQILIRFTTLKVNRQIYTIWIYSQRSHSKNIECNLLGILFTPMILFYSLMDNVVYGKLVIGFSSWICLNKFNFHGLLFWPNSKIAPRNRSSPNWSFFFWKKTDCIIIETNWCRCINNENIHCMINNHIYIDIAIRFEGVLTLETQVDRLSNYSYSQK